MEPAAGEIWRVRGVRAADVWPEWMPLWDYEDLQEWLQMVRWWYEPYYPYWVDPQIGHC